MDMDAPTTPDRAERARDHWNAYVAQHGGEYLQELIADLAHLADVDEYPGGGLHVLCRALTYYKAEQPAWPTPAPRYSGQYRLKGKAWITVATGDETAELLDMARCMGRLMQTHGFRTGELGLHFDDLARGEVLTADDGTQFRAIESPQG
jgi:hypothetical protein